MKKFEVDDNGYYGEFGGCHVSPALKPVMDELRKNYRKIMDSEDFRQEYYGLLKDYVGRPTPLYHAKRLSAIHGCRIYLKREDLNHTGAHKINNAIGQAIIARHLGKKRIIAETGAGQHGVAAATVCALTGMECTVFMGRTDAERQHLNIQRMKMLGADVVIVESGDATLSDAVDEALKEWISHPDDTFYMIGSAVGPHPYPDMVARLQSVISEEIRRQLLEHEGRDYPDYLVACIGGGSNAAGTVYHYLDDERVRLVMAEAGGKGIGSGMTAASVNCGSAGILHGSKTLVLQDAEGNVIPPYSISAGLDYPGIGPLHAWLAKCRRSTVLAITDEEALEGAFGLTRNEGIIPALESSHALAVLDKMDFKPDDVVVVTVSGRGDKDIDTYVARNQNWSTTEDIAGTVRGEP